MADDTRIVTAVAERRSRLAPTPENLAARELQRKQEAYRRAFSDGFHLAACGALMRHWRRDLAEASRADGLHQYRREQWEKRHDAGQPFPETFLLDDATALREGAPALLESAVKHLFAGLFSGGWQ